MSAVRTVFFIALGSIVAGFVWDILVWRLHFPYLPFHWLVRLLHADGEHAYTVMMYEMMVFFFAIIFASWIAWRLWSTR